MDESPFDPARAFDGVVGLRFEPGAVRLSPSSPDSPVYVSISGKALREAWAMGLEDDVRLLARAVAEGGASPCRELIEGLLTRPSDQSRSADRQEEVGVALHGLELEAGDEDELRVLIRMLVEARIARDGVRS